MNKKLLIGIVVLVVAGAAFFFAKNQKIEEATTADTYQWSFSLGEIDMPRTWVKLTGNGKTYEAGRDDGTCATTKTTEANELSAVLCWWAGGGKEIGVFTEGGKQVIKVGDVDEGDAETAGFRGNFKTLLEL